MSEKTTEQCVVEFGRLMEAKLAKNRRKGDRAGWLNLAPLELLRLLRGEVDELTAALEAGTADDVESECADVANFAMMVSDSFRHRSEPRKEANMSGDQENYVPKGWDWQQFGNQEIADHMHAVLAAMNPSMSDREKDVVLGALMRLAGRMGVDFVVHISACTFPKY